MRNAVHLGLCAIIGTFTMLSITPPLQAADNQPATWQDFSQCLVIGDIVEQPAGSPISACCTADYCIICDTQLNDCHREDRHASYQVPGRLDGGFTAGTFTAQQPTTFQVLPLQ